MITAVLLTIFCAYVAWRIALRITPRQPRVERRRSRKPLRGDLWLWEQEDRRDRSGS